MPKTVFMFSGREGLFESRAGVRYLDLLGDPAAAAAGDELRDVKKQGV